ncbi:hypothetical protein MLD38_018548 [Melastoma candidum]|uniref:Uncharacterized protein n=1 Tax=Melastoma candidum TaxID=119954 RepID=A0ACB9QY81_9MYRT|nr:hypothetical protein MLD38_018548 [Melastoma candidum]
MLSKKMGSFKKLARKVKTRSSVGDECFGRDTLLAECNDEEDVQSSSGATPKGSFAVYVGEERRRFVVPTGYLSHPLFRMLLEKSRDEFGFEQREGLLVPCSANTFREVLSAIEGCSGRFNFGQLVDEFV